MTKKNNFLIILILTVFLFVGCTSSGEFTDSRDGKSYKWVKIGGQKWMAENLNFDAGSGSWVYDNNSSYASTYGRLYNWETAKKVCPDGWHLPTDEEWKELEMYLSKSERLRKIDVGSKMAGNEFLWNDGALVSNAEFGTSGFTALPGSQRIPNGVFESLGTHAIFWSATEYDSSHAWLRGLDYLRSYVTRSYFYKGFGLSVRCIKD